MNGRALLQRLGQTVFILWVVTTLLFFMFRLMPGSPLAAYIDTSMTPEQQAILLHQFGLDQPLWKQYLLYLFNLAQGNLGVSFIYKEPVRTLLLAALPNTLLLTLTSLLIAYAFGTLAGAFLAARRGTWIETISLPAVLASRALPEFWLGMVLLAVFSFSFGLFPAGGATSPGASFPNALARYASLDFLRHLVLPALTLAIFLQGLPTLLMRSNMLEVMQEEFVVMSRIKGLSEWSIIIRHAARNALLPVATALALGIGSSLGGNVVVESVFSWPGLGKRLVEAVSASDYPLAQGAFMMIAAAQVVMNCVADVVYSALDPRVGQR
ncbi:ABC transporter permease [Rhodopila sp.]|uniref:ABC transporter permease n=1 Tax=Rhodopila sp. TaxID=2480087 RepID=UPI003D11D677